MRRPPLERAHHLLPRGLHRSGSDVAEGAAVDRLRLRVHQARSLQLAGDQREAARAVEVRGVEAAPGLHVAEDGRLARDPVEVVDREREPELTRDRQ